MPPTSRAPSRSRSRSRTLALALLAALPAALSTTVALAQPAPPRPAPPKAGPAASPAPPPPGPARSGAPTRADARTDAKAIAATTAARAQGLFDAGRYEEALITFRQSDEQFHAPTVVLMMARAQMKLGHLREARVQYQRVLDEKLADYAPQAYFDAQTSADRELDALLPRIPTLQIKIVGADPKGIQLFIDGQPAPHDIPVLHDPGEHAVAAWAPGRTPTTQLVELREGKTTQITLDLKPATGPVATAGAPTIPAASAAAGASGPSAAYGDGAAPGDPAAPGASASLSGPPETTAARPLAITSAVLLAAGGVGIGAGAVLGAMAADRVGQLKASCPGGACYDDVAGTYDAAQNLTTASTISLVVGGVVAAAGAGLLIWDSTRAQPTPTTGMQVSAGPGSLSVKGRF
ncbi:tetratricopeptide repeat protein [Chondromyces apiculatus]|uniref:PEGA domain-containing protein n=1 Tax=Chondromyces apiculatus DSM 436 TaxID=1192034 RepID=A0A017SXI7_9BACT|nr:tetratricopeptide repeat protein [Chondromyces apiculatus]EYF01335.1 Hypothetical protein CAP_8377 [Chondromyces apiculatus DSM 436]